MINATRISRVSVFPSALILLLIGLTSGCSSHTEVPSSMVASRTISAIPVIAAGVFVGPINIGGETKEQAKAKLVKSIDTSGKKIAFRIDNSHTGDYYSYKLSAFGGYFDIDSALLSAAAAQSGTRVPLPLKLDRRLVELHLGRVAEDWDRPVQEPRVTFEPDGEREIAPGKPGFSLDTDSAEHLLMSSLPTLDHPLERMDVPFIEHQPQLQPDQVDGVDDILTSFTTTFNPGNATRTNNLLLAIHNINGTVVGPGEVFSYNESVGPRTQQTGFQDAIIYVDNRMKKDVGGGICQGSSTLYNAVLLANLPIVERHAHSLPVHYVPAGRDATVAWGGDDFKFLNNTSKPIIVRAVATPGGTLSEYLIGDRNSLPHPNAVVRIDVTPKETLPDGFKVFSYRVVKEDGVLIAREPLGESYYHNLVGGVPH